MLSGKRTGGFGMGDEGCDARDVEQLLRQAQQLRRRARSACARLEQEARLMRALLPPRPQLPSPRGGDRLLGLLLTAVLALAAAPAADAQQACPALPMPSLAVSITGPLEIGDALDPALLDDHAVSIARRAGYPDYLSFRAVAVAPSAAAYQPYCADPGRHRLHLFWLREQCAGVIVSERRSGVIRALYHDCSAAADAAPASPGARLARLVAERFGDPLQRLSALPPEHREAAQLELLGLN